MNVEQSSVKPEDVMREMLDDLLENGMTYSQAYRAFFATTDQPRTEAKAWLRAGDRLAKLRDGVDQINQLHPAEVCQLLSRELLTRLLRQNIPAHLAQKGDLTTVICDTPTPTQLNPWQEWRALAHQFGSFASH